MPMSGALARSMASASIPLWPGMDRSINSTSISWARTRSMASRPLAASPTTRRSTCSERSEEHTSELQSHLNLVCRLLLEKKKVLVNDALLFHKAWWQRVLYQETHA